MNRKDYWNRSYLEYWKKRVDESVPAGGASGVIAGDAKTEDDEVYETIFRRHPLNPGTVLDVGCAWGRMFPLLKKLHLKVTGVDISRAMIEQAKKDWGKDPEIQDLRECEAETLSFPDGRFDNVACLAVFDATYQDQALAEFLRVLQMDGLLYLTGKNDNYPDDDTMAYQAEVGARGKNHPNFFTDTSFMLQQLREQGHEILGTYYFQKRGDFGKLAFTETAPDHYYEYFVIIRKKAPAAPFKPISDAFSKTFRRKA